MRSGARVPHLLAWVRLCIESCLVVERGGVHRQALHRSSCSPQPHVYIGQIGDLERAARDETRCTEYGMLYHFPKILYVYLL